MVASENITTEGGFSQVEIPSGAVICSIRQVPMMAEKSAEKMVAQSGCSYVIRERRQNLQSVSRVLGQGYNCTANPFITAVSK